jgi:threonine dehydrogenase-like Zn-dependent dehydrogenase
VLAHPIDEGQGRGGAVPIRNPSRCAISFVPRMVIPTAWPAAMPAVSLSPFRIYNDEIIVLGSMAVLNSFGAAAELMAAGTISTSPLLGPPFVLDQFAEALASVRRGEGIKIQVAPVG